MTQLWCHVHHAVSALYPSVLHAGVMCPWWACRIKRLRNYLFCVDWGVKPQLLSQSILSPVFVVCLQAVKGSKKAKGDSKSIAAVSSSKAIAAAVSEKAVGKNKGKGSRKNKKNWQLVCCVLFALHHVCVISPVCDCENVDFFVPLIALIKLFHLHSSVCLVHCVMILEYETKVCR